jgi:hypothetical protein
MMFRAPKSTLLALLVLALIGTGAAGSTASAAPLWKFDGHTLVGSEAIVGKATDTLLKLPGVSTECAHTTMDMEVTNDTSSVIPGGTAKVNGLLNEGCTAGADCTVERVEAEKLPWAAHLTTVAGHDYLVIEGFELEVLYGGSLCAFGEVPVIVKGSVGGLLENATGEIIFNGTSESATGTALKVGSSTVEWDALFVTEALGSHKGEGLEG